MILGKKEKIVWSDYVAPNFKPKAKSCDHHPGSCGTAALHLLTKLPVSKIVEAMPKKKDWWPDRAMVTFLKKHEFIVKPITINNITNYNVSRYKNYISPLNVILVSQHCFIEEGTWSVLYDNNIYHSNDCNYLSGLEFFHSPIWSAYLIYNPKWGPRSFNEYLLSTIYSESNQTSLDIINNKFNFKERKKMLRKDILVKQLLKTKYKNKIIWENRNRRI